MKLRLQKHVLLNNHYFSVFLKTVVVAAVVLVLAVVSCYFSILILSHFFGPQKPVVRDYLYSEPLPSPSEQSFGEKRFRLLPKLV